MSYKPSQAKPDDYPYICVLCGGHLAWDSSADASEILMEYEDDKEAVVNYFHCMKCGRDYEIVDPVKEEREKSYAGYWGCGKNTANNGKK